MFYKDKGKTELDNTVKLWHMMFLDEPYELVAMAVKAFIKSDTKGFPPVIGVISDKVRSITAPPAMSELEAWQIVCRALSNSGYNYVEEFERLPPEIRRVVGSARTLHEWAMLDISVLQTVVQSNFLRSFGAVQKSAQAFDALPSDVRGYMQAIAGDMDLKKIGGN